MANRDTRALVAHLFRRAGFGLRPDELDHFTALGVEGSVNYLTAYQGVGDPAETTYPVPELTQYNRVLLPGKHTSAELKAAAKLRGQAIYAIQEWWVNRMLTTARPLQEKMTLFWHGHFATARTKVPPAGMLEQNLLLRSMALGNFNTMLKAINQDPAMLLWLDGYLNRAGKPNENFGRELMELFTLGVGHYTEQDVREGARALTGWTVSRKTLYQGDSASQGVLRPRFHDGGSKTYLGHTGNLGSDGVMNILSAHPNTGGFLVRKLFEFFAYDGVDGSILQPFIQTYYSSKYDMGAVIKQILLSDAFYSDLSFEQHFKSPAEFVLGSVRELNVSIPTIQLIRAMTLMGQELLNPPNVAGWPGGITWLNPGTLVERFNFAGLLARSGLAHHQPAMQGTPVMGQGISAMTQPQVDPQTLSLANTMSLPNAPAFAPAELVSQSGAKDPAALVSYLLTRFVGIGATPATVAALGTYLGPDLSHEIIQNRVRNLVQLVLSSPEYQLN